MEPPLPPLTDPAFEEPETPPAAPDLRRSYDTTQDERLWAMLAYLMTFIAPILPPLVIYAVKRDRSKFVAFHALQSVFMGLAVIVVMQLGHVIPPLFPLLASVTWVAGLVYSIVAAIKAYDGEWYEVLLVGAWAGKQAGV